MNLFLKLTVDLFLVLSLDMQIQRSLSRRVIRNVISKTELLHSPATLLWLLCTHPQN